MAATPQARAAHLLGLSSERVNTPVTMTGGWGSVFSYALHVAYKSDEGFRVLNIRSSQTTNRHIRACHAALQAAGYVVTGTEETPDTVYRYYGAEKITREWTVYRLAETVAAEQRRVAELDEDNFGDPYHAQYRVVDLAAA